MLVGYRRSSTGDQVAGYEAQQQLLLATGCKKIFGEMASSAKAREQLDLAIDFVREGDVLVVCKMDRLARSTVDLLRIIEVLESKGVGLRVLDFGGSEIDTKSPTGRMMVVLFGAVAEFERAIMLERQRAGIARAKTEGRYKGRAPTARRRLPEMRQLSEQGLKPSEIADRLRVSRASVYRLLAEDRA